MREGVCIEQRENTVKEQHLREKTCFFTGHRNILREQYPAIRKKLEQELERLIAQGVQYFGVGGTLGFDNLAAVTVLKVKRRHPDIRLVLILPCKDHDFNWPGEDRELLENIAIHADRVVYTSEKYYNGCVYKQSRHMAEQSGWCVCYMERTTGGTAYAVNYAQSVGVRIINLAEH